MSELCQKCGATLSPGLCGICEREELRAEIKHLQKLLKMAEDELIESDNHGRAQAKRADALEAELENLRDASKNIAELQREACAWHCDDILHKKLICTPNDIRATSLVMTERN